MMLLLLSIRRNACKNPFELLRRGFSQRRLHHTAHHLLIYIKLVAGVVGSDSDILSAKPISTASLAVNQVSSSTFCVMSSLVVLAFVM